MTQLSKSSPAMITSHLANERTFLAWIRTSIAIMAFGFVVEKFSLFLKEIASFLGKANGTTVGHLPPTVAQGYSTIFGIILVALGSLMCLLAYIKYKKVEDQINNESYESTVLLDFMLTLTILTVGVFLTIYLINSI